MARFSGGGSLDGRLADIPARVTSVGTTGGSYYELDDTSGAFIFTGFDQTGASAMSKIIGEFRDDARSQRELIEAARRPRGCGRCGRTLIGSAAWTVHFESGEGSPCLPGDAYGQLEERDGAWILAGSDAARR